MDVLSTLATLSQTLVTPVLACFGAYIARQQLRANRLKLVLDRYDRRLRIYEEVVKILTIMSRDTYASVETLLTFRTATSEADFLFGIEIAEYLKDIYSRGMKVTRANREYRDSTQSVPLGYDHNKVVEQIHSQDEWLNDQFAVAKAKFHKYLDISN